MNPLQRQLGPFDTEPHVDDVIDDSTYPECVRTFLRFMRLPAVCKMPGWSEDTVRAVTELCSEEQRPYIWTAPAPVLFADLKEDQVGNQFVGHSGMNPTKTVKMKAGRRVRVVMASRFGDVGISPNLKRQYGYILRLSIADLTNFSENPERPERTAAGVMDLVQQETVCSIVAKALGVPMSNIGPTTTLDEAIIGADGKDNIAQQVAEHFEIPEFEREPAHWTRVSDVIGEVALHLAAQALRNKGDAMAAVMEDKNDQH